METSRPGFIEVTTLQQNRARLGSLRQLQIVNSPDKHPATSRKTVKTYGPKPK
jgi:hypothetical protein